MQDPLLRLLGLPLQRSVLLSQHPVLMTQLLYPIQGVLCGYDELQSPVCALSQGRSARRRRAFQA